MKKAAIIGAAGYVARELIGILVRHPEIQIEQAVSSSQHGTSVSGFHHDYGIPSALVFSEKWDKTVDVLFLCGGHGHSKQFLAENPVGEETLVVDLSMDFRTDADFVYGLPEIHGGNVSNRIANPGCFATAIQLAMLPMLGISESDWHIHAMTGSSGAGQQLQTTSHFSWRADNVSSYKVFDHQHLIEIKHHGQKLATKQGNNALPEINFIPLRGPFTRGIFATLYCETQKSEAEIQQLYKDYYADSAFTKVVSPEPDLKQVTGTNFCLLHPRVINGKLFITSIIDNLLKGAAGQAVENTNAFFGFAPETGLQLKPQFL